MKEKQRRGGGQERKGTSGGIKAPATSMLLAGPSWPYYHHRFESTLPAPFGWPRTLTRVGGGAVEVLPRVPSLLF